jgi:hypothetical protein
VTVKAGDAVVWSGRQQDLFAKYGKPAQNAIVDALKKMKK